MKQLLNIRFSVALVVATGLLMSSCLKNNKYYVDFSDYEPTIELPLAATNVNLPALALFDAADTPTTYYAVVNVASMDKPSKPVTATLALDLDWLNSYNAQQDANVKAAQADYLAADTTHKVTDSKYPKDYVPYAPLPDSTYSIESFDVTVQPGQRQGWVPIKIWTKKIDLAKKYILPLTIAKASIKISNWNHLMVNISAKNEWDGRYLYTGVTSLGDNTNVCCMKMTTVGSRSVTMNLVNKYSNQVVFTIAPDNSVTVSMTTLLPIATDPISKWDPATKTFHVKWTSNGGGRHYEEWFVKQ